MRNRSLDLIKCIAIMTMVIDHSRFLFFINSQFLINCLIVVGRFAFPMFCFALAVNFKRMLDEGNVLGINNYIKNILIYSFISEIPYMLMVAEPTTLNVMPTLLLGVIFMACLTAEFKYKWLLVFILSIILIVISPIVMYGLTGVLLPLGCLLALYNKSRLTILLPAVLAPLCNLEEQLVSKLSFDGLNNLMTYLICASSALSIIFCFYINKKKLNFPVWKVGVWGYWFYPAHMLGFYAINWLA